MGTWLGWSMWLELEPLLAFGNIFITFWVKIFHTLKFLPIFPARLLTTTICPSWRSIMWGRIAFVREIVPTVFKSRIARSTSSEVLLIKPSCALAPLLTKISTWKEMKTLYIGSYGKLLHIRTWLGQHLVVWNINIFRYTVPKSIHRFISLHILNNLVSVKSVFCPQIN